MVNAIVGTIGVTIERRRVAAIYRGGINGNEPAEDATVISLVRIVQRGGAVPHIGPELLLIAGRNRRKILPIIRIESHRLSARVAHRAPSRSHPR